MIAQKIEGNETLSLKRMVQTSSFNVCLSPLLGGWFRLLDAVLPPRNTLGVLVSKIVINQTFFSTFSNATFFGWVIAMKEGVDGKFLGKWGDKLKNDLVATQAAAWAVWPAINLINFGFVPLSHRVLVLNVAAMGWSTFMSMRAHAAKKTSASTVATQEGKVVVEEIMEISSSSSSSSPSKRTVGPIPSLQLALASEQRQ